MCSLPFCYAVVSGDIWAYVSVCSGLQASTDYVYTSLNNHKKTAPTAIRKSGLFIFISTIYAVCAFFLEEAALITNSVPTIITIAIGRVMYHSCTKPAIK